MAIEMKNPSPSNPAASRFVAIHYAFGCGLVGAVLLLAWGISAWGIKAALQSLWHWPGAVPDLRLILVIAPFVGFLFGGAWPYITAEKDHREKSLYAVFGAFFFGFALLRDIVWIRPEAFEMLTLWKLVPIVAATIAVALLRHYMR